MSLTLFLIKVTSPILNITVTIRITPSGRTNGYHRSGKRSIEEIRCFFYIKEKRFIKKRFFYLIYFCINVNVSTLDNDKDNIINNPPKAKIVAIA